MREFISTIELLFLSNIIIYSSTHYYRKDVYPFGVEDVTIQLKTRAKVYIAIIAPGKFYDQLRKFNEIIFQFGYKYHGVAMYKIDEKLPISKKKEDNCNSSLNWLEDDCKVDQLVKIVSSAYGCIAPWMMYYTK